MSPIQRIPWWAMLLAILVVIDISWRCWFWLGHRSICSTTTSISGKPVLVMADHHSNVDVISLRKQGEWETIYAEMDLNSDRIPDELMHYFNGRDVFNVNLQPGQNPKYDVYFYGPGKSVTWWVDRAGAGGFTDRLFYDTEGKLTRHEALLRDTWRVLETRSQRKGAMVDGQWIPLLLTTNGWAMDKTR